MIEFIFLYSVCVRTIFVGCKKLDETLLVRYTAPLSLLHFLFASSLLCTGLVFTNIIMDKLYIANLMNDRTILHTTELALGHKA